MLVICASSLSCKVLWSLVRILLESAYIFANHRWILSSERAQECNCLIGVCKLLSEYLHLPLQVLYLSELWIIILDWLVRNKRSLGCIAQR